MKLTEIPRLFSPTRWAIVAGIVLIAVCLIVYVLTEPGRANQRAAEARTAGALSETRAGSAARAGQILDQAHVNATTSEALSRENADAIAQAPGAGQRLDPGLNDTARRGMCKRKAYRRSDECVQLLGEPGPAG